MGQERPIAPVADVFRVMALVGGSEMDALWPGFRTTEIPVLLFDGLDTYLFHSPTIPEGFVRAEKEPAAAVYRGQHPLVRGNSIARLGDAWMATSVLRAAARRTGERYGEKDMAGIVVHEQFHVFQRIRHPDWRQNDAVLLRYPTETTETLFRRLLEKEAFRAAVSCRDRREISGWARLALDCRQKRLGNLAAPFAAYERELQRTEGLSDYIERRVRGQDPLVASSMTSGIAPAGIRDLGYVEGRWIAVLLDRLRPGWPALLEANDRLYPEEILKRVLAETPGGMRAFRDREIRALRDASRSDYRNWRFRQKKELAAASRRSGWRIEIHAAAQPLSIRMFEPLEMEILADGRVYHRAGFSAGGDRGSLRITNHSCLTWFNSSLRLTRISINGLREAPKLDKSGKKLVLKSDGVEIDLTYRQAKAGGGLCSIEL